MEQLLLEACVKSFSEAKKAQEKGAHRIELCENLAEGGTTPSFGTIEACATKLSIPTSVMIRPNGNYTFDYTPDEIQIMLKDIEVCKSLKVDGVVLGVLDSKGGINVPVMKTLVEAAKPLKVTFHMAFDQILGDYQKALETLVSLGVTRVLTKGFSKNAVEGKDTLKKMIEYAKGRITIMAGGGVTQENYKEIAAYTDAIELHGTKIVGSLI